MATNYGSSSPWFNTPDNQSGEYLDLMRIRTIPASPDDDYMK